MKCHEARSLLPHLLNDELSASERELLRAHLAECEACFAEMQASSAMQRQLRAGLHLAAERIEPSAQAWAKLHAAMQPTPQLLPQHRPAFMVRAIGAMFATLSVMVGAAALRPGLMGHLAPTAEAPALVSTQPTQIQTAQQPSARTAITSASVVSEGDADHKRLAAFLKSEPYQSVRSAIALLSEADLHGLDDFTCRTCARMQ